MLSANSMTVKYDQVVEGVRLAIVQLRAGAPPHHLAAIRDEYR